jgi:hypothetical protein
VTSADAPVELLAARSDAAARLRKLAAARALAYSIADAERLGAAFPEEPSCRTLHAIATLDQGPALRARAESELEVARDLELAAGLAHLARLADRALEPADASSGARPGSEHAVPPFVEALLSVASAPAGSVDRALAPLTSALIAQALDLGGSRRVSLAILEALGLVDPANEAFLPRGLRRAVKIASPGRGTDGGGERAVALEELALESQDTSTRASSLAAAVLARLALWQAGAPPGADVLERDAVLLDRLRAELEASGRAARTLPSTIGAAQRSMSWYRVVQGRGDREAELARGLGICSESAVPGERRSPEEARELLRFLLEQGTSSAAALDAAAAEPALGHTSEGQLLALEWRRRREGGESLRRDLEVWDYVRDRPSYVHAVRALVDADAGRFSDARKQLELVPDPAKVPPPLTSLSRDAVARYVNERAPR